MLPSRGLRPARFSPLSSPQSTLLRFNASRKFSSLPRTAGLSALSCRASPLQSVRWRTDASAAVNDPKTIDDLLGLEPAKDVIPRAEIDPTVLIDHAGNLKELGLDYGYGLTTVFERTIEQIYLNSGWGWAGSIMAAGVAVRCVTFFFQALTSDRMAGLASLKPLTEPLQKKLEAAIARGDKQQEQIYKMQQAQIMKPHIGGVFSMGGFMIVQMWVGFSVFRCLRAMGELPVPGMASDGFLWFSDLTTRDPYFLLPAATTAMFYGIFKRGGETGVSAESGSRQKLMKAMSFVIGFITAFQPAGLQLYFLVQGFLGAVTGWALRQNRFRNFLRIRTIPSPESQEVYSRVVKGELKLADIKGRDGKVRYQAPREPTKRRDIGPLAGIKIKGDTLIPAHLKADARTKIDAERPDRDADFEEGPKGTLKQKMDYYRRNYRPAFIARRLGAKYGITMSKGTEAQEKRKARAEQYEIERKRRFMNRK
ncbi:60Kd inner membrane protein-domain-containing protein [Ampelomyces quisqualis]|uniref:60Kd inner membrane protein-domain-containing protein n=1 Tax=Ampelomyces quisqualis TaxID=50730 RepID=A0A6A5QW85_AMPQU|nr:60Kd inner membrane protein-domain-containing protein [Ampelomyces quisqualis]